MDKALLGDANRSYAYVMKASKAEWSLTILDYVTRKKGSLFRIMKDRLSIYIKLNRILLNHKFFGQF